MRDQPIGVPGDRAAAFWLLRAKALAAERAGRAGQAAAALAQCLDPGFAADMPSRFVLMPALARMALAAGDAAMAGAAARGGGRGGWPQAEGIQVRRR